MTDRSHHHDDREPRATTNSGADASIDCVGFRTLVSGYVDGELARDERESAERHLVGCAGCRDLVDRYELVDADLRSLAGIWALDAPLPERMVSSVLDRTIRPGRRERRWRLLGAIGWATAAALALTWIGTARLGIAPDRPALPDGTSPALLVNGAGEVPRVATYASAIDTPEARERSRAAPAVSRTVTTPVGTVRYGIAQSPAHRGAGSALTGQLGLAETLPTLRGNPDWDEVHRSILNRRCGKSRACDQGGVPTPCHDRVATEGRPPAPWRPADSDTVYQTSLVLDRLSRVDASNLDEIERLRYVIAYDELIDRLAQTRRRLEPIDRPLVVGAECFLIRLLRGPVEEATILQMKSDLERLQLHDKLEELSDRLEGRSAF